MIQTLYVDDEPDLLEIGKFFLERFQDFRVETETSAKNALARILVHHYDAIISDYSMPEMDGIDFLRHIRGTCDKKIPFILFTGRGREEVVINALNSGADFYLQKGGDPRSQFAELHSLVLQATERRQMEELLQNSEERYRNVVEDQIEAICRFTPDGTHVFVNGAYCSLVGKKKEELIGKKNPMVIPPDDLNPLSTHLKSLTPEKPKCITIQRLILPDTSTRWIRCSDRAIFDENGRPVEYQSVITDITEQKIAEEDLVESRQQLKYIIDFLPDALYAVDTKGTVTVWNKAARELTGVSENEMLGKGNREYAVPFYGRRVPCLVDYIIHTETTETPCEKILKKTGNTLITKSRITVKDGQEVNVWIKASPLYDQGKNIIGAIEVIQTLSATPAAQKKTAHGDP
ncbi:MAG: PAS domain S-box protein [Methanoregula sp.]|nr:PAS domain S-box protein [Methanoregula sp.]